MQPVMMYKWGNKLKVESLTEPEFVFRVTVGETPVLMPPGKFYDLIRIMNMFIARNQVVLGSFNKEPVHFSGDRTKKQDYINQKEADIRQGKLFPDPEPESEAAKKIRELKEELKKLEEASS